MKYGFFPRTFDLDTGGAGGVVVPPAGGTGDPWYKGTDERTVGAWQNNFPQHISDPKALSVAVTASYLEAQKLLGAPATELVRVPSKADDPAWATVHKRLGKPDTADAYVLKNKDGADFDKPFADAIRSAAFSLNLNSDAAQKFATEVAKISDGSRAEAQAQYDTKLAAEKQSLAASWGAHMETNKELARMGAKSLGLDAEMVTALEAVAGYAKLMTVLHGVGVRTSEGKLITGGKGNGGGDGTVPMTREQASARKSELYNDNDFVTRFNKGDAAAIREMNAIDVVITNSRMAGG